MSDFYKEIVKKLQAGGISSPRLEIDILVEFVGKGKALEDFSETEKKEFEALIQERLTKKPLCKIVGSKGFYKYDFLVSEAVLSPRPDTETLVEETISFLKNKHIETPSILELGLGSGCVLLSVVSEFEKAKGVGLELSEKAIEIAQKNIFLLGQQEKTKIVQGSWFDEDLSTKLLDEKFEVIISNPPYIPSSDIDGLEEEVKNYDPLLALDGGRDGLRDYRQIAKISKNFLKEEGQVFLEIGINQAKDVVLVFQNQGFSLVSVVKDLAGIERCIIFKK